MYIYTLESWRISRNELFLFWNQIQANVNLNIIIIFLYKNVFYTFVLELCTDAMVAHGPENKKAAVEKIAPQPNLLELSTTFSGQTSITKYFSRNSSIEPQNAGICVIDFSFFSF